MRDEKEENWCEQIQGQQRKHFLVYKTKRVAKKHKLVPGLNDSDEFWMPKNLFKKIQINAK